MKKQQIDDSNNLYRRIHPDHIKNNNITSAAFKHSNKEQIRELSVDVAEWTSYEECLLRATHPDTKLGLLNTGKVRQIDHQDVVHDPLKNNYSHALIIGDKPHRIRRILAENCTLLVSQNLT